MLKLLWVVASAKNKMATIVHAGEVSQIFPFFTGCIKFRKKNSRCFWEKSLYSYGLKLMLYSFVARYLIRNICWNETVLDKTQFWNRANKPSTDFFIRVPILHLKLINSCCCYLAISATFLSQAGFVFCRTSAWISESSR